MGKRTTQRFSVALNTLTFFCIGEACGLLDFLHNRPHVFGQPLTRLLGDPQQKDYQWTRIPLLTFGGADVEQQYEEASWARAWHGAIEALYSVAYFERLFESCHQSKGERL